MENLNLFDDENQPMFVFYHRLRQYSLWLAFMLVLTEWGAVFDPASKAQCCSWLEKMRFDRLPKPMHIIP